MKRLTSLLAAFLILTLFSSSFQVNAASLPLRVVVDGQKVNFPDAQPFIDAQQRVQLPVRFVTEALGAKVLWDGPSKKATVILNSKTMVVYIGKTSYTVDGKTKQMDTAAVFKQSRTFVPLRFLYEGLGLNVNWDDSVKTVYITTGGSGGQTTTPPTGSSSVDVHGFKVNYEKLGPNLDPTYITASGMTVYKNENPTAGQILFQLTIVFSEDGADPIKGANEAENILRQKVEASVVDEVMKYARTKKKISDILAMKEFSAQKYTISVSSKEYNDVAIVVEPK